MYNRPDAPQVDHTIKDTRWMVEMIQKALTSGDKKVLALVGLNEVDALTYLRVYPQYATQSK